MGHLEGTCFRDIDRTGKMHDRGGGRGTDLRAQEDLMPVKTERGNVSYWGWERAT